MARDFDGVDDTVTFGSDASIDDITSITVAAWISWDDTATNQPILMKYSGGGWYLITGLHSGYLHGHEWSGAAGVYWYSPPSSIAGGLRHIVSSYDRSSTANNATGSIDNASVTMTEDGGPPSGTATSDAGATLQIGDGTNVGIAWYDGRVQNLCFASGAWTAAQINRHYWYGTCGGSMLVRHPMITTKTGNEGTATADATVTGATMASLPRTERMYCATMGCGR